MIMYEITSPSSVVLHLVIQVRVYIAFIMTNDALYACLFVYFLSLNLRMYAM